MAAEAARQLVARHGRRGVWLRAAAASAWVLSWLVPVASWVPPRKSLGRATCRFRQSPLGRRQPRQHRAVSLWARSVLGQEREPEEVKEVDWLVDDVCVDRRLEMRPKTFHEQFRRKRWLEDAGMALRSANKTLAREAKRAGFNRFDTGAGAAWLEGPGPDENPWRDRYVVCQECEQKAAKLSKAPKKNCPLSTVIEIDLTAPFSRSNCMVVSCQLSQLMMRNGRVLMVGGKPVEVKAGTPGSFYPAVCANCRKTSLELGRPFRVCKVCRGAWYCSNECAMAHRFVHRATCQRPYIPFRKQFGARPELAKLRKEFLPLIKPLAFRTPDMHQIPWKPRVRVFDIDKQDLPGEPKKFPPRPPAGLLAPVGAEKAKANNTLPTQATHLSAAPWIQNSFRSPRPNKWALDPVRLRELDMTEEEYINREKRLQQLLLLEGEKEAERQAQLPVLKQPEEIVETYDEEAPLRLDEESLDRIALAIATGPKAPSDLLPDEKFLPPGWEDDEDIFDTAESIPHRKGVVLEEKWVRSEAKKRGLRFSEKTLQRKEAAAKLAKRQKSKLLPDTPLKDNRDYLL